MLPLARKATAQRMMIPTVTRGSDDAERSDRTFVR
jgi:hypothetical protein